MNGTKTVVLLATMSALFVYVGKLLAGDVGMFIALIFACFMNIGSYWFSDKIVLKIYKAVEVDETTAPELYHTVKELALSAGLPMPRVYIIPSQNPNAFATGRNPQNAAVAVTEGILQMLSMEELKGVLGHELTHIRNRDILISTIAATIAGAISMIAQMAQWAFIFGGGVDDDDEGGNPLISLLIIFLAPIAAFIIQMAISRSREYAADEGGAKISGNPQYLASALRKLEEGRLKLPMNASPSTAHMFIVNPLTGGGIASLFSTHPPTEERIRRLLEMKK
ncbi:MAG: zinc metalloprotease HtpX [Candidatus Schekmanbacteria bacterium]|nr:MAG: zinc metalloprotease HtpX [Candidatus Schekmanbacteria bacterium]